MKNFSAKNKIILLVVAWLLVSAAMFLYFFNILNAQNRETLANMAQDRSSLALLEGENQSFKDAQADLQEMASKAQQPDDFFTKDTSLVDEIQTLEDLSAKYNLQMVISGLSGTVDSATPAKTVTPIVVIPYGISLTGSLSNIVDFMQNMENLQFITTVTGVGMSAGTQGQVVANLSANFYVRK